MFSRRKYLIGTAHAAVSVALLVLQPLGGQTPLPALASEPQAPKERPPQAQAKPAPVYIAWEGVPGATAYVVQVKDPEGEVVLEQATSTNRLDFALPPGNYSQRVGVKNVFGRLAAWSEWQTFRVISRSAPEMTMEAPQSVLVVEGIQNLTIKGANFVPETKLSLASKRARVDLVPEYIDSATLSAKVDAREMVPGKYDLLVQNPGEKVLLTREFLVIPGVEPVEVAAAPRETTSRAIPLYSVIPGAAQISRGETLRGVAWMGIFVGLAAVGGSASSQAHRSAAQARSSFEFRAFNDPFIFLTMRPVFRSNPELLYYGLYGWSRLERNSQRYSRAASATAGISIVALILYIMHGVDVIRPDVESPRTASLDVNFAALPTTRGVDSVTSASVQMRF